MKFKRLKLSIFVSCFFALIFVFSGCGSCTRASWQKVYNAYMQDPDGYQALKAIIFNLSEEATTPYCKLEVDAEDYEEHYKTDDRFLVDDEEKWKADLEQYNRSLFVCIEDSFKIVKENGFFDVFEENTVVTIYTHRYLGWVPGWRFPILGVEIGDKTYLDFETGKTNWLNYMEEQMK